MQQIKAAALIIRDKRVLFVTTNGERYHAPIGKKEEGASFADIVRRELREQLGVEVTQMRKYHSVRTAQDGHSTLIMYFLVDITGEAQPKGRARSLTWYGDGSRERTELYEQALLEKLLLDKFI